MTDAPYVKAMQAYNERRNRGTYSFDEAMAWHFNLGFVHSTPEFFIMGRPVLSTGDQRAILDYGFYFASKDAWYVALAAGDLSKAWGVLPYALPLIGFDRTNEVRFYPLEQVRRLTHQPT